MPYYHRSLEPALIAELDSAQAMFIMGPRQVGKTTLLKHLMEIIGRQSCLFYDIERPQDLELFSGGFDNVLARLRMARVDAGRKTYVLIDEIQYLDDFSQIIKLLVDHHANEFKLIMTGSSSALIRRQFKESLVGRKKEFTLYPLNFEEFCRFKNESSIAGLLASGYVHSESNPLNSMNIRMKQLLREYMQFGGYPRVVLEESLLGKAELLSDIVSSYVLKDIRHLFRIEKLDQFNQLIRVLSTSIGKEFSLQSLSQTIGLHRDTLKSYILVLESAYIIHTLRPFFNNPGKELRKMPKLYFIDLGIRNCLLRDYREPEVRPDAGELFENCVFLNLLHKQNALSEMKYWKSKNYQEVDFVRIENTQITAYEVKLGKDRQNHFRSFQALYPESECYTVRYDYNYAPDDLPAWF